MNILFTVLEIISDNVFLIAAVLFTNLFINTTDCLLSKRRLVVSLAVSAVSGILFRSNYISNHLLVINGILVVVNFLKFVILISYVHKIINRKLILITLILQFVCSVITSTVLLIIPFEDTYNYHLLITVCNLIVNFILLILIIPMQKRMDRYSFSTVIKIIPTYIYILILCAFFFLSGIVNITHHDTSNINIKITIIKFLAPLLTVCLLIIIL